MGQQTEFDEILTALCQFGRMPITDNSRSQLTGQRTDRSTTLARTARCKSRKKWRPIRHFRISLVNFLPRVQIYAISSVILHRRCIVVVDIDGQLQASKQALHGWRQNCYWSLMALNVT